MRGAASCLAALAALAMSAGAAFGEPAVPSGPDFLWQDDAPEFGGMSGLIVGDAGRSLMAVSDQGALIEADVKRTASGNISAIAITRWLRPKDNFGRPVSGFRQDAEDLARSKGGRLFIAFEGYARVSWFDVPDMTAHPTHVWDRFKPLWGNEGFEALAVLPDDRLVAIIETARNDSYATYVWNGTGWEEGPAIPGADGYSASGADLGPDGQLYLLERAYSVIFGFKTRIRRLPADPARWAEGDVIYEAKSSFNFEGISVWEPPGGGLRATLIEDDNFASGGVTRLRELILP